MNDKHILQETSTHNNNSKWEAKIKQSLSHNMPRTCTKYTRQANLANLLKTNDKEQRKIAQVTPIEQQPKENRWQTTKY